ncbi:MAG: nitroreductase family protein [Victivallaceae bacterium]|nr:nitroreductase family protein [Victivallaceae bacterium]
MSENNFNNSTIETIRKRHSIRQYSDRSVSDELIMTVLEAANCAPSAHNSQSWRFIVLRGEKKDELAKLVSAQVDRFPRPSSVLMRMGAKSILNAPAVIAIANTSELIKHGTELFKVDQDQGRDFFRTMEIQNSAAAVENLLLAATSLGLATVWLGILYMIKDSVLNFLGEPEGEFMAVVPIGYPARPSTGPAKRPISEVVKFME